MNAIDNYLIDNVIVYKGHEKSSLLGPYPENITKQLEMFCHLNKYRETCGRPSWTVTPVAGENLIEVLLKINPKKTLLVIPAGQSSNLDQVFSAEQISYIKDKFLIEGGGRLFATCGASYMMSQVREYDGLCSQNPEKHELVKKNSVLPLFVGTAKGPLCPYPGKKYQLGFYSDAVTVTNGHSKCTVLLSGGGSFFPKEGMQKVKTLVKYLYSELLRLGKPPQECNEWSNAAILIPVGKGAALLSMFHPDYGPQDIEVKLYNDMFPGCGTNWKAVKENLSPLDKRMQFVLQSLILPLEDLNGSLEPAIQK